VKLGVPIAREAHSTRRSWSMRIGGPASDLIEGARIDLDLFCRARVRPGTDTELLEEIAKLRTVDEIDRWGTLSSRFALRIRRERPSRDEEPLVASPSHRTTEVSNGVGTNAPAVALALEEDREAHK